jgi:hypothetical protein
MPGLKPRPTKPVPFKLKPLPEFGMGLMPGLKPRPTEPVPFKLTHYQLLAILTGTG